ncbi:unnamed protein product [Dracunculus medinensis]|uniref:Orfan n=1 Tax=Dracunculus medinensis TaxID=318479 RepID=A0A158Q3D4_DRAME|nr:unnamed protein product [Dracunculus medinensis]
MKYSFYFPNKNFIYYSNIFILLANNACKGLLPTKPLKCFDSSTQFVCYSEFYSVLIDGKYINKFERFCVYANDCEYRGIANNCVTINQLDSVVQKSFYENIAKKYGFQQSDLILSRLMFKIGNLSIVEKIYFMLSFSCSSNIVIVAYLLFSIFIPLDYFTSILKIFGNILYIHSYLSP